MSTSRITHLEGIIKELEAEGKETFVRYESIVQKNEKRIKELKREVLHENTLFIAWRQKAEELEAAYGRLQTDNQKYIDKRIAAEAQLAEKDKEIDRLHLLLSFK